MVKLGNDIQTFARNSLKDAKGMSYDLEKKRSGNVDALMDMESQLLREHTQAQQQIHTAKVITLDSQQKMLENTNSALTDKFTKDKLTTDADEVAAEREMRELTSAVDRGAERHRTNLATAKEQ